MDDVLTSLEEIYRKLGTDPVPVDLLTDKEVYEREVDRIFKKVWLKVGRVFEIPQPGDYKVKRLEFARTSVILVRGKDNKIRAFHNICPHRGNKIIPETGHETSGKARASTLTCRFHGWVFDTAGPVRMIPKRESYPGKLDLNCLGLKEIHCDTWEGYIFINLDPDPDQSLDEFLGGIKGHFSGYPFTESTFARKYSAALKCNWKVALFAFAEAYHVETIHAATLPGIAGVVTEQTDFRVYGPHCTSGYYVKSSGSTKSTEASRKFAEFLLSRPAHAPRPEELPASVNPQKRADFLFEFPVIFPNLVAHLCAGLAYPGMTFFDHIFWPIDHEHTYWEGTNYYRQPQTAAEHAAIVHTDTLHRNAWLEDTSTMEDTHAALMSGVIDSMPLMGDELMVRNAHFAISQVIAA